MSKIQRSVLILIPGAAEIPSVRLRILQYISYWHAEGFAPAVMVWEVGRVNNGRNILRLMTGCRKADFVLIHRVVFGRFQAELIVYLLALLNKPFIFDFDDALYALPVPQALADGKVIKYSGRKRNLDVLLRNATAVIVGNSHLAAYAAQFTNAPVTTIPTMLDVANLPTKIHKTQEPVVVGWVGTTDNLRYLEQIRPVLKRLSDVFHDRVLFRIVSGWEFPAREGRIENVRWSLEREVDQVLSFDVGLMPLTQDEWATGKSGFKAVFYQSLGIPAVVTPNEVVVHGETGFYAQSEEDWIRYISMLVESFPLRVKMGQQARTHAEQHFSLSVALTKWRQVFNQVTPNGQHK